MMEKLGVGGTGISFDFSNLSDGQVQNNTVKVTHYISADSDRVSLGHII